jgi:hypothetical protein
MRRCRREEGRTKNSKHKTETMGGDCSAYFSNAVVDRATVMYKEDIEE